MLPSYQSKREQKVAPVQEKKLAEGQARGAGRARSNSEKVRGIVKRSSSFNNPYFQNGWLPIMKAPKAPMNLMIQEPRSDSLPKHVQNLSIIRARGGVANPEEPPQRNFKRDVLDWNLGKSRPEIQPIVEQKAEIVSKDQLSSEREYITYGKKQSSQPELGNVMENISQTKRHIIRSMKKNSMSRQEIEANPRPHLRIQGDFESYRKIRERKQAVKVLQSRETDQSFKMKMRFKASEKEIEIQDISDFSYQKTATGTESDKKKEKQFFPQIESPIPENELPEVKMNPALVESIDISSPPFDLKHPRKEENPLSAEEDFRRLYKITRRNDRAMQQLIGVRTDLLRLNMSNS
eukprot:TRINITY_DN4666_c0_g1_i1.p1 TRINITY_DN4666_c0_g1~~TRINITY_DN4666_c0_g1_i1.p1  ORF type:complete len:350 (-),score=46.50 TRINITY_DN4666_c0_g1_i1:122-1171(-)